MGIKEMRRKMEREVRQLRTLGERLGEARRAGDAAGIQAAQSAVTAKSAAVESLRDRLAAAVAESRRQARVTALLDEAAQFSALDTWGKELVPAEALDRDRDEIERVRLFADYLQGKQLSGLGRQALAPRSEKFNAGAQGAVVPASLRGKLLPHLPFFRKALPALSSVSAQGGALVNGDFRTELLESAFPQENVFSRITVIPAASGSVTWPKLTQTASNEFGGVEVQWITEGETLTDTEAIFEQMSISTHELAAYTEVSHRLLSRASLDMEAILARLFRSALVYSLGGAVLTGTGSGQPAGISGTTGVNAVERDIAGEVGYEDLVDLETAVAPYHRVGACFIVSPSALQALKKQKDAQERPLFLPNAGEGLYATLLGYPVVVDTHLPAVANAGCVLFGNLQEYIGAMEEEVVVKRSDDYKFKNNVVAFSCHVVFGGRLPDGRTFAKLTNAS